MANPFDQFDQSNPFDQFDAPEVDISKLEPVQYSPQLNTLNPLDRNFQAGFKVGLASMFGDDEDYALSIQENFPGSTVDERGVVTFRDGSQYIMNEEGLDPQDAVRFAGKVAQYVPAGRAAAAGRTLAQKMGIGAAGAAATDLVGQAAVKEAGGSDISAGQVATSAALGAGAEALAPVFGAGWRALKGKFAGQEAKALAKGQEIAKQLGLEITDDQAKELGVRALTAADNVDPKKLAAEAEFGVKHTRGQLTDDVAQLKREEVLRQTRPEPFRRLDEANSAAEREALERLQSTYGGRGAQSVNEAADNVFDSVKSARDALKGQVDEAYSNVDNLFIGRTGLQDLPQRALKAVQESGVMLDEQLTPAAKKALASIDEAVRNVPDNVGAVSIKAVETQRRRLNTLFDATANKMDRKALQSVKAAFDDWMDDAVDTALYSGDEKAIAALKDARALRAKYGKQFEGRDEAGKMVQKMFSESRTPEEIGNFLVGVNGTSKANAARMVERIKEIAPESVSDLKELVFLKLVTKQGSNKTRGTLLNSLREGVEGKGQSMMRELYSPQELSAMSRFVQAFDGIMPKGQFKQTSGTAERLLRAGDSILGDTPGLGWALKALQRLTGPSARSAMTVPQAPVTSPLLPLMEAQAGS